MKPGLLWACSPALPKSATGELVAAAPNKKILTIQIRPAKVITELARNHSDSVSASSNHYSSALLNHANRSRRAPPQPFRGQAREKCLRASSQVFCESYPRNRPAVLVLPADQTPNHVSRISAMEGQQQRKPLRRNHALNVIRRLPLRNHRLCGIGASATSPGYSPGHDPNLFGSQYSRAPARYPDFVRFAQPRAQSCASQSFLRAAAIRGCKECRCKQRGRTILDTLAPIVSQTPWRSHTGWSAATVCSRFAASPMHSRKFRSSKRDKIATVVAESARFRVTEASPFPLLRKSILESRNSGRHGFVRRDDTVPSAEHRQQCDSESRCRKDRHSGEISGDHKFFHRAADAQCAIVIDGWCAARFRA